MGTTVFLTCMKHITYTKANAYWRECKQEVSFHPNLKAATWSSVHTFPKFYHVQTSLDPGFGHTVLKAALGAAGTPAFLVLFGGWWGGLHSGHFTVLSCCFVYPLAGVLLDVQLSQKPVSLNEWKRKQNSCTHFKILSFEIIKWSLAPLFFYVFAFCAARYFCITKLSHCYFFYFLFRQC